MDRSDTAGLTIAIILHVAVFALLSASFLAAPKPMKSLEAPIDVSLVDEVGLVATAPQFKVPPAESRAPDAGPPEDAPPPEPKPAAPLPVPPAPQPKPAPPAKPAEFAKPNPKKPTPEAPQQAAKSPPKREAAPATPARPSRAASTGTDPSSSKPRPRGSRLGDDFLKGLTDKPSPSKSVTPRAAVIDARALASIQDAISRQIQPCADRQVNPGPGANEIVTVLNLRLNPDGTLAATPTMVRQTGTDGEAGRYARRVIDLGIAAFKGCSPLRLPPEYYQTPSGGWNNINYKWQLR
ncbi:cell envelope biogenesis protein TolA [Sphingomonas sp. 28-63-12]|uniref:cell envelope biogenesis protein TolA n=1 Tax=Sphingomonas sp. 28-63-12 TaxID=1970434 RepID=UPI000BD7A53E|nr:MAG: hypothetical protein B7Y47_06980 [Sphingomonas sp. 28-63-12]